MTLKQALFWLIGMHRPNPQSPIPNPSLLTHKTRPPLCPICHGRPLGPIICDCGECDCDGLLLHKLCPFCGGAGVVPRSLLREYEIAAATQAQPASPCFGLYNVAAVQGSYHEAAKRN
jgi:hypothetical protein